MSKPKSLTNLHELLVLRIGLAGRAGDEGRADRDAGDPLAQLSSSVSICLRVTRRFILRQQLVVDVLQRHVDVLHDASAVGDRLDHLVGEARRVRVHQPQPVDVPAASVERLEQAGQAGGVADVGAVAGRVLADQVQLDRAVGGEFLRLEQDLLDRLGPHRPADGRDRAERAALVAPFADAQVRVVARRQAQPGAVVFEDRQAIGLRLLEPASLSRCAVARCQFACDRS